MNTGICKRCGAEIGAERRGFSSELYIPNLCLQCFDHAMTDLAKEISLSETPTASYAKGLREAGLDSAEIAEQLEN